MCIIYEYIEKYELILVSISATSDLRVSYDNISCMWTSSKSEGAFLPLSNRKTKLVFEYIVPVVVDVATSLPL